MIQVNLSVRGYPNRRLNVGLNLNGIIQLVYMIDNRGRGNNQPQVNQAYRYKCPLMPSL
jgi:hypothetical protein